MRQEIKRKNERKVGIEEQDITKKQTKKQKRKKKRKKKEEERTKDKTPGEMNPVIRFLPGHLGQHSPSGCTGSAPFLQRPTGLHVLVLHTALSLMQRQM